MRKKQIVGNWKMQKSLSDVKSFFADFDGNSFNFTPWIAPQALHITTCIQLAKKVSIGAQNSATENTGAFTGENSPASIKDLGAEFVLIGHSERRSLFHEDPETLKNKILKAQENKLTVIFCIGEKLEEREQNKTFEVLESQITGSLKGLSLDPESFLLAYEPVWAIGTGKTATAQQAAEAHSFCRKTLENLIGNDAQKVKILYGGSVKPSNVESLLSLDEIDGALVGGASLEASDFQQLCECAASKNG